MEKVHGGGGGVGGAVGSWGHETWVPGVEGRGPSLWDYGAIAMGAKGSRHGAMGWGRRSGRSGRGERRAERAGMHWGPLKSSDRV